jgi:hypothetical protein
MLKSAQPPPQPDFVLSPQMKLVDRQVVRLMETTNDLEGILEQAPNVERMNLPEEDKQQARA